jgi:hypothetical protein
MARTQTGPGARRCTILGALLVFLGCSSGGTRAPSDAGLDAESPATDGALPSRDAAKSLPVDALPSTPSCEAFTVPRSPDAAVSDAENGDPLGDGGTPPTHRACGS